MTQYHRSGSLSTPGTKVNKKKNPQQPTQQYIHQRISGWQVFGMVFVAVVIIAVSVSMYYVLLLTPSTPTTKPITNAPTEPAPSGFKWIIYKAQYNSSNVIPANLGTLEAYKNLCINSIPTINANNLPPGQVVFSGSEYVFPLLSINSSQPNIKANIPLAYTNTPVIVVSQETQGYVNAETKSLTEMINNNQLMTASGTAIPWSYFFAVDGPYIYGYWSGLSATNPGAHGSYDCNSFTSANNEIFSTYIRNNTNYFTSYPNELAYCSDDRIGLLCVALSAQDLPPEATTQPSSTTNA